MGLIVGHLAWLLLLAAIVAIAARRLRLPYTVGLLLAGVMVAFSPWQPELTATKELIFTLFLPPLIFEAAFSIRWSELRRDLAPITAMATLGTLASSAIVFVGMKDFVGWDWRPALMFATLISATDPVSVIAMLKEAKAEGRLPLFLEAESLFNDGAAAAMFAVGLAVVSGGSMSVGSGLLHFLTVAGGGLACGVAVAFLVLFLMWRTEDHLVEITCTVVAAFGAFLSAEHFGFSGVLATLVAGLILGNVGPMKVLTCKGRDDAQSMWELLAFVVNSLLFILMGARLTRVSYGALIPAELAAILLVLVGRSAAVYGTMLFFGRSRYRLDLPCQSFLVWGGLRGALGLALALGLPVDLPGQAEVVTVVFATVAFSTVVQGITVPNLWKRVNARSDPNLTPRT